MLHKAHVLGAPSHPGQFPGSSWQCAVAVRCTTAACQWLSASEQACLLPCRCTCTCTRCKAVQHTSQMLLRPGGRVSWTMPRGQVARCIAENVRFAIESEEVVSERYLTLYNRKVVFRESSKGSVPDSERVLKEIEYDIIGSPAANFSFAVAVPFHSATEGAPPCVTLIREYCQGPNCVMYNLPTGSFSPKKHSTLLDCAQRELSEEAALKGGTWSSLLPPGHPGICEVKWCANRFIPFLVVDAVEDPQPGAQDPEELIEVERVGVDELRNIMASGDMLLPALTTCHMALAALQAQGRLH